MGFVGNYIRNLGAVALGRQPTRPLMFSYYLTHRCDLNCSYCCDGDGKRFKEDPTPELTTEDAKQLVSILRGAADTLDITGGEPMLRPDLEEILAHARGVGFRVILNTKGIGLEGRPDVMRLANVLVLSLDTLDPGSLAELLGRPKETAEKVLDAFRFALAERTGMGTKLVISAVATPDNLDQVAEVLRLAAENSVGFHVSPEIIGTRANPALRDNESYRRLIDEVLARKQAGARVFGIEQYMQGIRGFAAFRCHPLLMPVIRPDGHMYYPCLESKKAEIDVLEAGSYWSALDAARRRNGGIPECRDCCHIFCHMAISLLQRHPIAALRELRVWRR